MKRILILLIFYFSLFTFHCEGREKATFISKGSIEEFPHYLHNGWIFNAKDDSAMAQLLYNDGNWIECRTTMNMSSTKTPKFNGVGWFRYHFITDSTVTARPLAMMVTHFGASQIYLDGKLIRSFGVINGKDSSVYFDPEELPFIFTIPNTSEHVIAVRYANFDAERNARIFLHSDAGFLMQIGEPDTVIYHKDLRTTLLSLALSLLIGFFFAFCLIHFFMYLHYKSLRSNLYFSIFMFSLAICFVIGFICYSSHTPFIELISIYFINAAIVSACIALSGFINELFNKKKLRFKVIASVGIVIMILRFCNLPIFGILTISLIIGVSIEAVINVLIALFRRVRGAKIIGTGILFFTLFILTIFTVAMLNSRFDIDDRTTGGQIIVFILALAIISIPVSMSVYLAWDFSSINKNLAMQLDQVKLLSDKTIEQEIEKQKILENKKEELEKEVMERTSELRVEKKKSDDLLLNILPADVAEELKNKGSSEARDFEMVTVMFTDFKDFTMISEKLSPTELVKEIDYCFSAFDNIIHKHGIEKIKTIGDAYMCAGGLPVANKTHAEDTVKAAIEIRDFMANHNKEKLAKGELPFEIRIGINTGPVVAGIVGVKKFAYDIWGDTVNLASRMESSGKEGEVNISGSTYELVKDKFTCSHRGKIQTKNKGEVDMYFVN